MKRFYQNLGHEPVRHRTWILFQDSIDAADFKWLNGLSIPITVEQNPIEINSNGVNYQVAGRAVYSLDTTTDKQRDMLVLKYGDSVLLVQEETVAPGTISSYTL